MEREAQNEELLSLTKAAAKLGIHPATLRRWADKGDVRVVLTPGGHRRFSSQEIDRLRAGNQYMDLPSGRDSKRESKASLASVTLEHTRHGIEAHTRDSWREGLAEADIQEKRALGRRLIDLVTHYLADGDQEHITEARAIGRLYGKSAIESGLGLADALKATFFFRQHIMESAVISKETGTFRTGITRETLQRLDFFLNAVELAIAEVVEAQITNA